MLGHIRSQRTAKRQIFTSWSLFAPTLGLSYPPCSSLRGQGIPMCLPWLAIFVHSQDEQSRSSTSHRQDSRPAARMEGLPDDKSCRVVLVKVMLTSIPIYQLIVMDPPNHGLSRQSTKSARIPFGRGGRMQREGPAWLLGFGFADRQSLDGSVSTTLPC